MIFKIYKYATYILEEASVPFAWQTDTLESTLYYIHDRALGILWASQPVLLRDFFKEIGLTDFVVPEENNHYPASFTDNNFEQKYMSFQLALIDEPQDAILRIIVIGLDIYCLSGRILHALANDRTPSPSDLLELQKMCFSFKQTQASQMFYSTGSDSPVHEKEENEENSIKEDYVDMLSDILEGKDTCPPFADMLTLLTERYPISNQFQGRFASIYFENKNCFVRKRRSKSEEYTQLNDRTLQNYYTEAKKIHKRRFCEK